MQSGGGSSSSCMSEDSQEPSPGAEPFHGPREVVGKKLKRREKNRAAAQKSRQKQTEKADVLHQEHERLEKDNATLRKEIEFLTLQLKHWTKVLQDHELTCIMSCPDVYLDLLHNVLPSWTDEGLKVTAN